MICPSTFRTNFLLQSQNCVEMIGLEIGILSLGTLNFAPLTEQGKPASGNYILKHFNGIENTFVFCIILSQLVLDLIKMLKPVFRHRNS